MKGFPSFRFPVARSPRRHRVPDASVGRRRRSEVVGDDTESHLVIAHGCQDFAPRFLLTAFTVGYRPEANQGAVILDRAAEASNCKRDRLHGSRLQIHAEVDNKMFFGHPLGGWAVAELFFFLSVGLCKDYVVAFHMAHRATAERIPNQKQRRGCLALHGFDVSATRRLFSKSFRSHGIVVRAQSIASSLAASHYAARCVAAVPAAGTAAVVRSSRCRLFARSFRVWSQVRALGGFSCALGSGPE